MGRENPAGERRCWPCAVSNAAVGLVVGWLPFAAASLGESPQVTVFVTAVWGLAATTYTGYRLVVRGYLPYAERAARLTGLHDRIGPGRREDDP